MKIEQMSGFRIPTKEETTDVSRHMHAYYRSLKRKTIASGIVLTVMGVLLLIGGISAHNMLGFGLGITAAAGAVCAFYYSLTVMSELLVFEKGEFYVMDGNVSRIEVCPDTPGMSSVEFTSVFGQTADGVFEARQEGLEMGTPILLVYVPKEKVSGLKAFTWVFTPFMLTEEGAKKHR